MARPEHGRVRGRAGERRQLWGREEEEALSAGREGRRTPVQIAAAAAVLGGITLVLAAITGPPYLGSGGVNGWLIGFVVALFAFLLALPFAIERLLRESYPDTEARWDRAVPAWGGIALLLTVVGVLTGIAGGFAGDSLAGSAGLLMAGAGGLVLIAVLFMLLAG